mmetsp:Transcript_18729/g.41031  ORF Transcript_18729/g.41031 Transcript_18729/m.41031 type:complete len:480 (-) Transcript_18729:219-1658(-)
MDAEADGEGLGMDDLSRHCGRESSLVLLSDENQRELSMPLPFDRDLSHEPCTAECSVRFRWAIGVFTLVSLCGVFFHAGVLVGKDSEHHDGDDYISLPADAAGALSSEDATDYTAFLPEDGSRIVISGDEKSFKPCGAKATGIPIEKEDLHTATRLGEKMRQGGAPSGYGQLYTLDDVRGWVVKFPLNSGAEAKRFELEKKAADYLARLGINAPTTYICWAQWRKKDEKGKVQVKVLVQQMIIGSNMMGIVQAISIGENAPKGCMPSALDLQPDERPCSAMTASDLAAHRPCWNEPLYQSIVTDHGMANRRTKEDFFSTVTAQWDKIWCRLARTLDTTIDGGWGMSFGNQTDFDLGSWIWGVPAESSTPLNFQLWLVDTEVKRQGGKKTAQALQEIWKEDYVKRWAHPPGVQAAAENGLAGMCDRRGSWGNYGGPNPNLVKQYLACPSPWYAKGTWAKGITKIGDLIERKMGAAKAKKP